jgi:hypothetical protein
MVRVDRFRGIRAVRIAARRSREKIFRFTKGADQSYGDRRPTTLQEAT